VFLEYFSKSTGDQATPGHLNNTQIQYNNNMRSSNLQMVGRMYQLEFFTRNKSRGVSYIPGAELSSLIMQIRGRGRPTRDARSDAAATKPQEGGRVQCVWCGSARPLLMQRRHTCKKLFGRAAFFLNLPLARSIAVFVPWSCADLVSS
jgi:hypothetical protein